jgi:hypothetical protein
VSKVVRVTAYVLFALSANGLVSAQKAAPTPKSAVDSISNDPFTRIMTAATDAYTQRKFGEAAREYAQAASMRPDSEQAQFWAGQAFVYNREPAAAIPYLEAAQRDGADYVALHEALIAAYAGTGRTADRDRERALLHQWAKDGQHPTLEHADGFLLETFYTKRWHVNVLEFYGPHDGRDALWKFTVRDPAEAIEFTMMLLKASEAKGVRWVLISTENTGGTYQPDKIVQRYEAEPTYDDVRADVLKKLRFRIPLLEEKKP